MQRGCHAAHLRPRLALKGVGIEAERADAEGRRALRAAGLVAARHNDLRRLLPEAHPGERALFGRVLKNYCRVAAAGILPRLSGAGGKRGRAGRGKDICDGFFHVLPP